jgi:hypothetical protein
MKMQDLKPANVGGGKKKSNGHKAVCGCPICKNMEKKGGYKIQALEPATIGGKKSNGHKANCGCPICVNMKHQKASKKNRRVTTRHTRRGGDKEDEDKKDEDKEDEDKEGENPNDVSYDGDDFNPNPEDGDGNDDNNLQNVNLFPDDDDNAVSGPDDVKPKQPSPVDGGRKKRKGKGNGHKPTCKCPICKNIQKSRTKKGGDEPEPETDSETMGGSRRRRSRKSRKSRKTRRQR